MKFREPSKLEMQVLSVLWQRGPSTVREVLDAMPDGKTRAYTTILSVLQVMEKKGLLSHKTQGNVHVYSPRVSKEKVAGPLLQNLVSHVFGGSAANALQHLLSDKTVSRQDLEEMKRLISEHEEQGTKQKKGSNESSD
jgi:BlaI family transcriptional regulator, penicillinase repressor